MGISPELIEQVAKAIYERQRNQLSDQTTVTASREWRSRDIPDHFWNEYVKDAVEALNTYHKFRVQELYSGGGT